MRVILASVFSAVVLAGCGAKNPNDGAQYFDNITPSPAILEAENARLKAAEGGTPIGGVPQETVANTDTAAVNGDTPVATDAAATISDSQNFKRVKERETIESDAAKLAALKESYQVVPTEALPTRGTAGANLAAYALRQKNAVGVKTYRRINIGLSNCSKYRKDPDGAQRAFLKAGGPKRDKLRLDSDGDGFACGWNPDVYRSLVQISG